MMSRLFSASTGLSTWRSKLADPQKHWKRTRSAMELAASWESRRDAPSGLPIEVEQALVTNAHFAEARLLFASIEHQVQLDNRRRPSQNDLWLAMLTGSGHVSVTVEGKAGEDFDKRLEDWLLEDSQGKRERLAFLCGKLGIEEPVDMRLRYQLFHRTASAVLEAQRMRFPAALMLVQSFAESATSWADFAAFAAALGLTGVRGAISGPKGVGGIELFVGWVDSPLASDAQLAAVA